METFLKGLVKDSCPASELEATMMASISYFDDWNKKLPKSKVVSQAALSVGTMGAATMIGSEVIGGMLSSKTIPKEISLELASQTLMKKAMEYHSEKERLNQGREWCCTTDTVDGDLNNLFFQTLNTSAQFHAVVCVFNYITKNKNRIDFSKIERKDKNDIGVALLRQVISYSDGVLEAKMRKMRG